jgi:Eukaryotic aspartyl protease
VNQTSENLIKWMNLTSPNYWQVRFTRANVYNSTANNGTNYTIYPLYSEMVLDSGSTYSYIPTADYTQLYKAILSHGTTCSKNTTSGLTLCTCSSTSDSRFLNITLSMGGRYMFYFNSSNYLTYDSSTKKCILTLIPDDSGAQFWLMGASFLRGYYVIHDLDNQRVGFAGSHIDMGP